MKKFVKDPEIYFLLGLLGLIIAIPSENIYVKSILIPIFFLFQLIGLIFIIKKYLNEKKDVMQGEKKINNTTSLHSGL